MFSPPPIINLFYIPISLPSSSPTLFLPPSHFPSPYLSLCICISFSPTLSLPPSHFPSPYLSLCVSVSPFHQPSLSLHHTSRLPTSLSVYLYLLFTNPLSPSITLPVSLPLSLCIVYLPVQQSAGVSLSVMCIPFSLTSLSVYLYLLFTTSRLPTLSLPPSHFPSGVRVSLCICMRPSSSQPSLSLHHTVPSPYLSVCVCVYLPVQQVICWCRVSLCMCMRVLPVNSYLLVSCVSVYHHACSSSHTGSLSAGVCVSLCIVCVSLPVNRLSAGVVSLCVSVCVFFQSTLICWCRVSLCMCMRVLPVNRLSAGVCISFSPTLSLPPSHFPSPCLSLCVSVSPFHQPSLSLHHTSRLPNRLSAGVVYLCVSPCVFFQSTLICWCRLSLCICMRVLPVNPYLLVLCLSVYLYACSSSQQVICWCRVSLCMSPCVFFQSTSRYLLVSCVSLYVYACYSSHQVICWCRFSLCMCMRVFPVNRLSAGVVCLCVCVCVFFQSTGYLLVSCVPVSLVSLCVSVCVFFQSTGYLLVSCVSVYVYACPSSQQVICWCRVSLCICMRVLPVNRLSAGVVSLCVSVCVLFQSTGYLLVSCVSVYVYACLPVNRLSAGVVSLCVCVCVSSSQPLICCVVCLSVCVCVLFQSSGYLLVSFLSVYVYACYSSQPLLSAGSRLPTSLSVYVYLPRVCISFFQSTGYLLVSCVSVYVPYACPSSQQVICWCRVSLCICISFSPSLSFFYFTFYFTTVTSLPSFISFLFNYIAFLFV